MEHNVSMIRAHSDIMKLSFAFLALFMLSCNFSMSPQVWEARREVDQRFCFIRPMECDGQDCHEVVSSAGSFVKNIPDNSRLFVNGFTPDFSGTYFITSDKVASGSQDFNLFVQLRGTPRVLVARWRSVSWSDAPPPRSVSWLADDGSRFLGRVGADLAYFQRKGAAFYRTTISKKVHAFGIFGNDVYYAETDAPRVLRHASVGSLGVSTAIHHSALPLDTIVLAGPNAAYMVTCLEPADTLSLEDCRIVDLKSGQSRLLPPPRHKKIGEIISFGSTPKVILHVWSGRELLDGSSLNPVLFMKGKKVPTVSPPSARLLSRLSRESNQGGQILWVNDSLLPLR